MTCIRASGPVCRISPTACDGCLPQLVVGDESGDHTEADGLLRVEPPGREEEVAGDGDADMRGEDRRVGGVDDAPQQFGRAESGPVAGDGDVRHHGDQQAAGLADPVHRGHHRRPAVTDGEERQEVRADVGDWHVTRLRSTPEITAALKTSPVPVMIMAARSGSLLTRLHRSPDAEVHGRRERVPRLRPVDDAPTDHTVALEAKPRCAEIVAH